MVVVTCGLAPVARAEVVRSFDVDVKLLTDTTLDVTETILYDFETAQRHGIYRDIPVRYTRNGGSYTIYFNLLSVTKENGEKWKYTTSRQWSDIRIKIGDADTTITGQHTYRIHYTVRRAVNFFEGVPEVYWNATGNEWDVPIEKATARFTPPPKVATDKIKATCFMGPFGSKTPGSTVTRQTEIVFFATNLAAKSGLTFVAGLPAGSVVPPTTMQNIKWFLADWWPAVFFPLMAILFVMAQWMNGGRDVDKGLAVGVEWNPPHDLTPAEVGTLVDERCDMADIVSTLVDLAARGYLTIQEESSEKFLFFQTKDYIFTKKSTPRDPSGHPLLPYEHRFLSGLFSLSDQVTLSSLKHRFYTNLPPIREGIYASLHEKRLFNGNPEKVRNNYYAIGGITLVVGFFALVMGAAFGFAAYGLGLAVAGLIVLLSAKAMPSKTATGSRKLRECLGFQRFVQMAEKDRIAVLAKEDPTIFGRLLPYAMVLGVADQWADAFKDLLTAPPDWYYPAGYGHGYHFSSVAFVNDLGHGMNTMGNTFSSTPPSSGGSGGSGFSGGGSGGGFGGGGGGSW